MKRLYPKKRLRIVWVTPTLAALLLLLFAMGWTVPIPVQVESAWLLTILNAVQGLLAHVSWVHVLSNIAFLLVFGIPVERSMGNIGMLLVSLVAGTLANTAAIFAGLSHQVLVGASGSVSAVIGAYLVLYPKKRIGLLIPMGVFVDFVRVPVPIVIGLWFAARVLFATVAPHLVPVAWWAHIAGLVFGFILTGIVKVVRK